MESNREQTLSDIEASFEASKAERLKSKLRFESAKGRLHMQLVAKRESGVNLTVSDMKAIEAAAIDDDILVKEAYLSFCKADMDYRASKVAFEDAKRRYWDSKPIR